MFDSHAGIAHRSCCIVQLNWCQWAVSITCLESIFRQDHRHFRVIWCDNNSPDGSVAHLVAWAEGMLDALPDSPPAIRELHWPPVPKPIPYDIVDGFEGRPSRLPREDAQLVIVRNGGNDGCAAGYNIGLRLSLALAPDYVWILNNDTVVRRDALTRLIERTARDPSVGMCGSTVLDFDEPDRIQAQAGAAFNFRWGTAEPISYGRPRTGRAPQDEVERRLDYVLGASMLIPRHVLEETGLMPLHFFMYFEEIAWAQHLPARYRLAYAPASEVFHRDTAPSDTPAEFYGSLRDSQMLGNRLVFAKIYRPGSVPFVVCGLLWELFSAVATGKWARARMMLSWAFWRRASRETTPASRYCTNAASG
ncbi:MAG: glycosyltransferase family 2 protein [Acidobacteriota bacterium]|nr:glycosyltransferase family 2 protein [Acidobacteriota bacterium]